MSKSITRISDEPKVAKNAVDMVSRLNPTYHFPTDLRTLERQLRISFGLPYKGRHGGSTDFGYTYVAETDTYEPNEDVFRLLWQARRYLYTSAIREVADWINSKTEKLGHPQTISHEGLRKLMVLRPPYEECLLSREEKEKILESIIKWNTQQK